MEAEKETDKKPQKVRKSIRAILALLLIFFLAALAGFLLYFNWILKSPLQKTSAPKKLFEVKNGDRTFDIGQKLMNQKLIKEDWAFYLDVRMKDKNLEPGIYELSADMSMEDIVEVISSGKTKIVKITIPEGYRTEQIAEVLANHELVDYNEFVKKAKQYEGQLFPDTYYFSPDHGVDKIISAMKDDYDQRTASLNPSEKDLIIASIVEREASNDTERPIIAGIYQNRLKIDMKLEADPTVQYARDNRATANLDNDDLTSYKYWKPITAKDYHSIDSAYNTYETSGLPPGPICNPGLASIEAAINYQQNNYLYFIQAGGKIYPAKTLAEHEQNKQKYLK